MLCDHTTCYKTDCPTNRQRDCYIPDSKWEEACKQGQGNVSHYDLWIALSKKLDVIHEMLTTIVPTS